MVSGVPLPSRREGFVNALALALVNSRVLLLLVSRVITPVLFRTMLKVSTIKRTVPNVPLRLTIPSAVFLMVLHSRQSMFIHSISRSKNVTFFGFEKLSFDIKLGEHVVFNS